MTLKSSTVLISRGNWTCLYRSLDDVPPHLRRELLDSTGSEHARTILIADRNAREHLGLVQKPRPGMPKQRTAKYWAPLAALIILAICMWLYIAVK